MREGVREVKLDVGEIEVVTSAAILRRKENIRNGKDFDHKHGVIEDSWGNDIESTGAEVAVAKYMRTYWGAPTNNFKDADVCKNIQVRHSVGHGNNCIIRKKDSSNDFYVLVTGRLPDYRIQGYVFGKDGKDDHFINAPRGKEAAWFYPQVKLKCIDGLDIINEIAIELDAETKQKLNDFKLALLKKYNAPMM